MDQQNLWAPWRMDYLRGLVDPPAGVGAPTSTVPADAAPASHCFLCDAAAVRGDEDEMRRRLVLLHDDRGMILLNRYPYTNGHLLVAAAAHAPDLTDLTPAQRAAMIELVALAEETLRAAVNPQGMNLGVNLGRCAGAGVPGHLHFHLVPRWNGDVNFINILGGVRVIPEALEKSFAGLKEAMGRLG